MNMGMPTPIYSITRVSKKRYCFLRAARGGRNEFTSPPHPIYNVERIDVYFCRVIGESINIHSTLYSGAWGTKGAFKKQYLFLDTRVWLKRLCIKLKTVGHQTFESTFFPIDAILSKAFGWRKFCLNLLLMIAFVRTSLAIDNVLKTDFGTRLLNLLVFLWKTLRKTL